jgi:hypothetical protein
MYNVQDYSVLYNKTVRLVICEVDILLTCGKQFHDHIISLRGEIWDRKMIFMINKIKKTDLRLPWFYMGYLRFLNIIY